MTPNFPFNIAQHARQGPGGTLEDHVEIKGIAGLRPLEGGVVFIRRQIPEAVHPHSVLRHGWPSAERREREVHKFDFELAARKLEEVLPAIGEPTMAHGLGTHDTADVADRGGNHEVFREVLREEIEIVGSPGDGDSTRRVVSRRSSTPFARACYRRRRRGRRAGAG